MKILSLDMTCRRSLDCDRLMICVTRDLQVLYAAINYL